MMSTRTFGRAGDRGGRAGGLDRLAAGESGEAAAASEHLGGCAGCSDELARLRRVEALLRPAIRDEPAAGAPARTLDYVRAVVACGERRKRAVRASRRTPDPRSRRSPPHVGGPGRSAADRAELPPRSDAARAAWPAAVAAALVIGLAGGLLVPAERRRLIAPTPPSL